MKLLSFFVMILVAASAFAEEGPTTYNFYFQKAPGPVTVNQGGAPVQAAAPAPAVPQATAAPAPQPTAISVSSNDVPGEPRQLHLSLGYALANAFGNVPQSAVVSGEKAEHPNGQYAMKLEYDLTRSFSLTGEAYMLRREVSFRNFTYVPSTGMYMDDWMKKYPQKSSAKNVFDFSVGGALHLARFRSTTFSLIGGFITVPKVQYYVLEGGTHSRVMSPLQGVEHEKTFFAGARLRLIADDVWGLDLSYRAISGAEIGVAQLGLTFAI